MTGHVEHYLQRVHTHMEGLPPRERVAFISAERCKWLVEYARFERRMAKGKQPDPGESAATYLLGIAELGKLKGLEERKAAVIPVDVPEYAQDGWDPERAVTP